MACRLKFLSIEGNPPNTVSDDDDDDDDNNVK
jgi:hypothetical protein